MDEDPILVLNGEFELLGRRSFYIVKFLKYGLLINEGSFSKEIKYTDIYKIKYSLTSLKIILKTGEKIKMPCNSSDIKKVKTYFRTAEELESVPVAASAAVTIAGTTFFVVINSTNIKEFKIRILKRIAKHIYPACETEEITLEMFENLKFLVYCEGFESELCNSEDLAAALIYNGSKLRIFIRA